MTLELLIALLALLISNIALAIARSAQNRSYAILARLEHEKAIASPSPASEQPR